MVRRDDDPSPEPCAAEPSGPPPLPSDPSLPRFAGWVTVEKLGEGGMCEVYRARPADGGPERAVKVLMDRSDAAIRRFIDEAALLARIDHPNVVKVHAIDSAVRPPWLVMDLLGGRDLEETLRRDGRMDPERAARMFADLASGLSAVHAAGVRHRDIKPANLRLGTDGIPRLIDFGIARDAASARQTRQGFVVGTAAYLPPEVFADDDAQLAQDSESADVYALGQTLCEVLVGEPIHHGRSGGNEASLLVRIMRDKLDRDHLDPRELGAAVPEELAQIVARATTREPSRRTPTAAKLEEELRGFLDARASFAGAAPLSRVERVPSPTLMPDVGAEPDPDTDADADTDTDTDADAAPVQTRAVPQAETAAVSSGGGTPASPADTATNQARTATQPARPAPATSARATPAPAPPAVVRPPAPAPSGRRGCGVVAYGLVGGLGVAGTAAVVVAALALAVVGGAALVAFRPRADPAEDRVLAVVAALGGELSGCRVGPGQLSVELTVHGGKATARVLSSTMDRHTERCVTRVLTKARYPDADVTVAVPVVFR